MADSKKYGRTANLFDASWESGTLYNGGGEGADTNSIRTIGYINCLPNQTYEFSANYEIDETWVNYYTNDSGISRYKITNGEFTTPVNCTRLRFRLTKTDLGVEPVPQPQSELYTNDWQHSLRKLTTATEAVENPLYSDGTAITAYTLKGNTVQNGTPTPSNPVEVNGVGERTENLFDDHNIISIRNLGDRYGVILPDGVYSIYNNTPNQVFMGTNDFQSRTVACDAYSTATVTLDNSFFGNSAGFLMPLNEASQGGCTIVEGSTPPDHYIPYGYKIPISSGGVTTNIYLGSTQTVRQIKKLVLTGDEPNWGISGGGTSNAFMYRTISDAINLNLGLCSHFAFTQIFSTSSVVGFYITTEKQLRIRPNNVSSMDLNSFKSWLSDQYTYGTPVIIYYVLATPETAAVNEPLMKIGDYADTLSNAASIPTTEGANSITVDTTVQPSEFTATWTGWHDASVKEWDGSDWQ